MERHLGKRFEDERLRRLIAGAQDIEALRALAVQLLELKIGQEVTCYELLFNWQGVSSEQVEAMLSRPAPPPIDPFDNAS